MTAEFAKEIGEKPMLEKTMLIKMNQQAYGTARFQILTGDQIERIYFAALDVLEIEKVLPEEERDLDKSRGSKFF